MSNENTVKVGQVYEDFVPIYTDSKGQPIGGRRRLKVVALDTKQARRWDAKAGRYRNFDDAVAAMEVLIDAAGNPPAKKRTVKVRIDRIKPEKGGFTLVEDV